jgi:hypothetical protein
MIIMRCSIDTLSAFCTIPKAVASLVISGFISIKRNVYQILTCPHEIIPCSVCYKDNAILSLVPMCRLLHYQNVQYLYKHKYGHGDG